MINLDRKRPDWAALRRWIDKRKNRLFSCEFKILEDCTPESIDDQDTLPMRGE